MSLAVPTQRTLKGVAASLRWQPLDGEGSASDPGTVTVTVTKSDGTAVVSGAATSGSGTDPRTYALAAPTQLDTLTVEWKVSGTTVATTYVEVVGGYWASVPEITERCPGVVVPDRPVTEIVRVRTQVESEIEDLLGFACVPRYALELVEPYDEPELIVRHGFVRSVRSARLYYTSTSYYDLTAGELASVKPSRSRVIERYDGLDWCGELVEIGYEHGMDRPPADLLAAFFQLFRYRINQVGSSAPDRATSITDPVSGATTALAVPGRGPWHTGIPDVDEVIQRYTQRIKGIK